MLTTNRGLHPLVQAFSNEPLLIDPGKVDAVSSAIQFLTNDPEAAKLLNTQLRQGDESFWEKDEHPYRPYAVKNGVLQVAVQGTLINHFGYQFGRWATGYQYIEAAIARGLSDPEVKAIALICDSPGGEAAGCFELTDKIHEAQKVKPIRAFVADAAYSAAYAIASAATDVVVTRSGGTGSVGAVSGHVDVSAAMERQGVKITLIYAGEHKVDGNAYEKLPDAVKDRIQLRVNNLYEVFISTVARNRGMDESDVRETKALTFDAQDSLTRGFADRIGALDEEMIVFGNEMIVTEDEEMTITPEQMEAAVSTARAEGSAEGMQVGMKAGAEAERTRVSTILGSPEAQARPAAAQMMIDLAVPADKAAEQLAKLPEEKAAAPAAPAESLSGFAKAMADGNPQVGANAGTSDDAPKLSVVDGIFASVGHGHAPRN